MRQLMNCLPLLVISLIMASSLKAMDSMTQSVAYPLHIAARDGNLQEVRRLHDLQFNLETVDEDGYTPLHLAALRERTEVVTFLIKEAHADIEAKTPTGHTPLLLATFGGSTAVARFLVKEAHANTEATIELGYAALHVAAREGHAAVVTFLVQEAHANREARTTSFGETPLHMAAKYGRTEIVKFLINDAHANREARTTRFDQTPLHIAVEEGHVAVVTFLVKEAHADTEARTTSSEETSLHIAAKRGRTEVVTFLVNEAHADIEARTTYLDETPLHHAAIRGHTETCECILSFLRRTSEKDIKPMEAQLRTSLLCLCRYNVPIELQHRILISNDNLRTDGALILLYYLKNGFINNSFPLCRLLTCHAYRKAAASYILEQAKPFIDDIYEKIDRANELTQDTTDLFTPANRETRILPLICAGIESQIKRQSESIDLADSSL